MAPTGRGHWSKVVQQEVAVVRESEASLALQAESGEVAVTVGDPRMGHQGAIDEGHETAEQRHGRGQGECGSLKGGGLGHQGWHRDSLVGFGQQVPRSSGANLGIPDARCNRFVCIAAICHLQCNKVAR